MGVQRDHEKAGRSNFRNLRNGLVSPVTFWLRGDRDLWLTYCTRAGAFSSHMPSLPAYLSTIAWSNPSNPSHTLFNYAQETPLNMFAWLQTQPEKLAIFGATMAAGNALRTRGVLTTLSRLFSSDGDHHVKDIESDVLLVDVGGGRGKLLERFREQRPELEGRMILQDLPEVIKGREAAEGVEYMVHDFFNPQPIKGLSFRPCRSVLGLTECEQRSPYLLLPSHFP